MPAKSGVKAPETEKPGREAGLPVNPNRCGPLDEDGRALRADDTRADRFYEAVVRYFPALERSDLSADQVGVRPKVQAPGEGIRDFIIADESGRGLPGRRDRRCFHPDRPHRPDCRQSPSMTSTDRH